MAMTEFVQETWEKLGKRIRPLRRTVFVRTLPFEDKIGSLYLPPKLTGFYGELPHLRLIEAVVLSVGPDAAKRGITVGMKVVFKRLHFAMYATFSDLDRVGWLDVNEIVGTPAEES